MIEGKYMSICLCAHIGICIAEAAAWKNRRCQVEEIIGGTAITKRMKKTVSTKKETNVRKRIFGGAAILVCFSLVWVMIFPENTLAQSEAGQKKAKVTVKGKIAEIPEEGDYILVDDGTKKTKFLTDKETIDEAYFELGDKVNAFGEIGDDGVMLTDYEYIYGESGEDQDESQDDSDDIYDFYPGN